MVSGGNVLVQVSGPALADVKITLNGSDVTNSFRPALNGRAIIGRVGGLRVGSNRLEAKSGNNRQRLEIVNYPPAGPVFAGPHQVPFVCQTEAMGLGAPLDADCSAPTVVGYMYKSTDLTRPSLVEFFSTAALLPGFKPFDAAKPKPADMAQTTTTEGRTVDFIVRVEKGTVNRAIYEIAFLHQPGTPLPDPWTRIPGWNGRLVYLFGGDCKAGYHQGTLMAAALSDSILSHGYAMAASTLNVFGNNCDDVISAETMMMVKELFTKKFGVPLHTIGTGASGGSMQQHLLAQNYPGLLDGIIPAASFPDITTMMAPFTDCFLLDHAFRISKSEWTDVQKTAVSGFATWKTCANFLPTRDTRAWGRANSCDEILPREKLYNSTSNPNGIRCTLYDNEVNVYGRALGKRYARRPLDNVGVQYGLKAFNAGTISFDQFLELNRLVGGLDNNGETAGNREVADPDALRVAYESGRVNNGAGLAAIPIIDIRPYLDPSGDIHDRFRSMITRQRLIDSNGDAENQVILLAPGPPPDSDPTAAAMLFFDPKSIVYQQSDKALLLMDRWLDNIAADSSPSTLRAKVVKNKPAELVDACWTTDGQKIAEPFKVDGRGRCDDLYPRHGDPRMAAGEPLAEDTLKCRLKPVDVKDYAGALTVDQIDALRQVFSSGVCDFKNSPIGKEGSRTWLRY